MILTYFENIDLGSASVNFSIVSQYHIIYTDLKVHNCIILLLVIRFKTDWPTTKIEGVSCDHGGARLRLALLCSQLTPYILVVGQS